MVHRYHKIKLDPNNEQAAQMARTAGTVRYAWNWGIDRWEEMYANGESCNALLLDKMWSEERPDWTHYTVRCSQSRALFDLGQAYKMYFAGKAGKPNRHKRGKKDSFYVANTQAYFSGKKIYLPKIGFVRVREQLRYEDAKIMGYTVKREADGWYVYVNVEIKEDVRTDSKSAVGVDLGCKTLAVASDETKCEAPKTLKELRNELRIKQKLQDRKQFLSHNWEKARRKVARCYQRISNVKQDVTHKFTAAVAKTHGMACCESFNLRDLMLSKNKFVRKGVNNAALGMIRNQLRYKCNDYVEVDKYFPSSKICSKCGHKISALSLSDRTYVCEVCGYTIDRDLNAAINLRNEGLKIYTAGHAGRACGENC